MNKLGPVISAHYREGSFLNIAKYVFKFPKSLGVGHFVLCFFVLFLVVTVIGAGRDPTYQGPYILLFSYYSLGVPCLGFPLKSLYSRRIIGGLGLRLERLVFHGFGLRNWEFGWACGFQVHGLRIWPWCFESRD